MIEMVVFFLLLIRTIYTDIKLRKIENEIILLLFVNKGIGLLVTKCLVDSLYNLFVAALIVIAYLVSTDRLDIGGGDIKLLCGCILYIPQDDIIVWLLLIPGLMIVNDRLIRKFKMQDVKYSLAPFVGIATIGVYLVEFIR